MEQFEIKINGYDEFRKQSPFKAGGFIIFFLLMIVLIDLVRGPKLLYHPWAMVGILIGIIILTVVLDNSRYRELRNGFESYTLVIEDQLITREQDDMPTVSILRNEVSEITKDKKGNFTIIGNTVHDKIKVPAQIENSEKLELLLNTIQPVVLKPNQFNVKEFSKVIAFLGLMAVIEISKDKIILGISGVILLAFIVYSIYQTQQDRNMTYKAKTSFLWALLLLYYLFKTIYDKLF